jgi:hypothetical protein
MDTNTTRETEFVFRRLEEALHLFGRDVDPYWFWTLVLLLVVGAGFTYVGWMYKRDSQSVGGLWAAFLAVLRCSIYAILGMVFLLPAWQTWERTESHSKVVLAFDVSGSMGNKDDLPTEAMPVEKLPTRQDKVIQFLKDEQIGLLKHLQEKNPVYLYRFGGRVDEAFKLLEGDKSWLAADRDAWLKPQPTEALPDQLADADRAKFLKVFTENGLVAAAASLSDQDRAKFLQRQELLQQMVGSTNLGDSLREVFNREANNMVQGIIVFSDGRSTGQYSSQAFEELRSRADRANVPIFTVVVGEYRQPISIRITDLQAPEQARPEDKFPLRVEIDGEGLPNAAMEVSLDVTNPKNEKKTLSKTFKFNTGAGGPPHAQVEFEIDAAQFGSSTTPGKPAELEEGEWKFVARVPKDKREIFLQKEHQSRVARVQVVQKPLRVLLFAGGPTHDYQFVRSMFVREVDQHRAELSICLQLQRPGVVQDVPADRLLKRFPDRLESEDSPTEKAEDRYANLAYYDVIVAFDPDWSKLEPEQLTALTNWVSRQAGGLIIVASPVNTTQLTRLNNREKLKPILDLLPVYLKDSVLERERPSTEPWRLHFPGANREMEFLKLDEAGTDPLAGWEQFFTGNPKPPTGGEPPAVRGFYSYYPAKDVKPGATVVATFADPRARTDDNSQKEQPYLVTMPFGNGKVVYLGSGETWRLRQFRESYYERFWTKLARYAGSGNLMRQSRRGVIVMGQEFSTGQFVPLEAQLFGRDLRPLPETATPQVVLQPPHGEPLKLELKAKPRQGGEWAGWFETRFRVTESGEYRLNLKISETGETLPRRFLVKESNPELDNTRPDFGQMYQVASEMSAVVPRLDKNIEDELRSALESTAARLLHRAGETSSGTDRSLPAANEQTAENGKTRQEPLRLFFDLSSATLIPKCMVTDSKVQRSRGAVQDLWDQGFTLWSDPSVRMASVLLLIVTLLSIEWLTRKLLKLA